MAEPINQDSELTFEARKAHLAKTLGGVQEELAHLNAHRRELNPVASDAELLPVTKFHPVQDVVALAELGVNAVGENREQEAREKYEYFHDATSLKGLDLAFHMIGQIQTKKANHVARWATLVHTVDSQRLAHALDRGVHNALDAHERTDSLDVLVQWSADGDPTRGGVVEHELMNVVESIDASEGLILRGLMTVPPLDADPLEVFGHGREILDSLSDLISGTPVYSAGMSQDMEQAVAAGSTLVRVGTKILGSRPVV